MAPPDSKQDAADDKHKSQFHRLPTDVVPKQYQLTLDPDLVNFTFAGSVTVHVAVQKDTAKIFLNALDMKIESAQYTVTGEPKATAAKSTELLEKEELLVITMPSALKAGTTGLLEVSFIGNLNDKMKGFYRAKYAGSGGAPDTYAAVTQFESTDARRMFPCWDEPAVKATFDVTVIAPKNLTTLSNMPVVNETDVGSDKKKVKFAVTPIMSTYLLAVVVGDYDYVETKTADGKVVVRVYAPPSKKDQCQFALDVAAKSLDFYSKYFNIPYPLPKLDMVGISDVSFGAMENWGLVTYREARILVDPVNTAAAIKQNNALIIAHELAHQWFGNLVTMEWWTHLWLNEGFAVFMEYLCVDDMFPEYEVWDSFVSDSCVVALELDALRSSHAIEVPVGHPSEIDEIFDQICYEKGSSIIRMLYRYLGDADFRKGMSLYLNKHAYKNTQTEDLWSALAEASGKPVRDIMSSWTKQMGFPLITVSQEQAGTKRTLTLSQSKFSADGKLSDAEKAMKWMVPITAVTASSPKKAAVNHVLSDMKGVVEIADIASSEWVKLNQESIGVYRVQYSPDMLTDLLPAIQSKQLPPIDRLTLVTDLVALVQAGKSSTVEVLKLLEAYKDEDHYSVWTGIVTALAQIGLIIEYTDYEDAFKIWAQKLLMPIFSQIGWQAKAGEKHTDALLRSLILGRMVALAEPSVVVESKRLFEAQAKGTQVVPVNIRSPVYAAVAKTATDAEFDGLFKLYRETDQHEEKRRLLRSIGSVSDRLKLEKALAFSISDEVRIGDLSFVLDGATNSKVGRDMVWSFLQQNRKLLVERYANGLLISRIVKCSLEKFATEDKAAEMESYFAENEWPGTERGVRQLIESVRVNAAWLARDSDCVRTFLQKAIA